VAAQHAINRLPFAFLIKTVRQVEGN